MKDKILEIFGRIKKILTYVLVIGIALEINTSLAILLKVNSLGRFQTIPEPTGCGRIPEAI
jgi:hypothetical protein